MARILMTLIGIIFLGLGVWLAITWLAALLLFLQGLLIIVLMLLGLALLIFGISEIAGARRTTKE